YIKGNRVFRLRSRHCDKWNPNRPAIPQPGPEIRMHVSSGADGAHERRGISLDRELVDGNIPYIIDRKNVTASDCRLGVCHSGYPERYQSSQQVHRYYIEWMDVLNQSAVRLRGVRTRCKSIKVRNLHPSVQR